VLDKEVRGGNGLVKRIYVDTFLDYLGQGMSKPALILADDAERYILKTQKVMHNGSLVTLDCMFLNELLACQIADFLDVPVPEGAIAQLDQQLIDNDPSIMFVHKFYEGTHFASLQINDVEDNLLENYEEQLRMQKPYVTRSWSSFFKNIKNPEKIANIIAFDLLIANFDRYGNTGNLLVADTDLGRQVFSIDHGHAFFNPIWGMDKINSLRSPINNHTYYNWFVGQILGNNVGRLGQANGLGEVFRSIESNIDLSDITNHSFQSVVSRVESITEDIVDKWLKNIPDEWFVAKNNQIQLYKNFILSQKDLVRYLIQNLASRSAFSNYRGGVLEWTREQQVGTV
jgi:hypothetical protein